MTEMPASAWPPPGIDQIERTNNSRAADQHPKDHTDLEHAVNAILAILGTTPHGSEVDLSVRLAAMDEVSLGVLERLLVVEQLASGTQAGQLSQLEATVNELVNPYQPPGVATFAMDGQATTVEVGLRINGVRTFSWSTTQPANVKPASLVLSQDNVPLASGLAAAGSTPVPVDVVLNAAGSRSWKLAGESTRDGVFSGTFTVTWRWRGFHGVSAAPTLVPGSLGAGQLVTTPVGTYAFPAGGFKYFAFPAALPAPSDFLDAATNLSVTMAEASDNPAYDQVANGLAFDLMDITTPTGITTPYRVYRTRYTVGGALSIKVV